jgi:hypothetical protein
LQLSELLSDHDHTVCLYRFMAKWQASSWHPIQWPFSSGWLGPSEKDIILHKLLDGIQDPRLPLPTPDPKSTTYDKWQDSFSPSGFSSIWAVCLPSEGPSFLLPFIWGVLLVASHHYLCICIQLLFCHAFCAEYSKHFCSSANDNTECPCRATITHPHITLPQSLTVPHGLLYCTDGDTMCPSLFSFTSHPLHLIFSMEEGGKALCEYIHATQMYLCPLPPCSDPL